MTNLNNLARLLDESIDDLTRTRLALDALYVHVTNNRRDAYRSQSFDPTGRTRGVSDPTAATAADPRPDPILTAWRHLQDDIHKQARLAFAINQRRAALTPLPANEARRLAELEHAHTSTCENCGRTIAGTSDDRIRAGRCHTCYTHWKRTGQDRTLQQSQT